MTRALLLTPLLLATLACGVKLPPITITVPPRPPIQEAPVHPTPPALPAPEPEPVVTPEPEPEPAPAFVVELPPLVNLNIVVHDAATGAGIPRAVCTIGDDSRSADGAGFINFAVRGSSTVRCAAGGFEARPALDLPPGDHRVPLVPIAPPVPPPTTPAPPPPAVTPAATTIANACGPANNSGRVSQECLDAVAAANPNWLQACQAGDAWPCHRIVRSVVKALRLAARQVDPEWGWGLLTKGGGEQGCNETECDGSLGPEGKYAEDVITFLRPGAGVRAWVGADVVAGIGAPGARFVGGAALGPANDRPSNKWAPVP